MSAIRELIEAIERGEWPDLCRGAARVVFPYRSASVDDLVLTAVAAFNGSVDAALELMAAVLPGWAWTLEDNGDAWLWPPNDDFRLAGDAVFASQPRPPQPARALLLATLKAMEARQ